MPQSRLSGLLLIALGVLTFLGTTNQLLPAVAFFPGLVVCGLGSFIFLRANHEAMNSADRRIQERLHPVIKPQSESLATRRAAAAGGSLPAPGERAPRMPAQAATAKQVQDDELVLYEVDQAGDAAGEPTVVGALEDEAASQDDGFVVTTDVSFPLELQQQSSLADQLAKLRRLADDGIISEEEFAVAKAKLLA